MSVYDDNFLAAVARHFVSGLLQQFQLQLRAVSDGTGLVFGLENLPEIIFGINDGILLPGAVQRGVADVDQIGAERQLRPVLLENAERQHARALSFLNGGNKVTCRELFPLHRQRLRGRDGGRRGNQYRNAIQAPHFFLPK